MRTYVPLKQHLWASTAAKIDAEGFVVSARDGAKGMRSVLADGSRVTAPEYLQSSGLCEGDLHIDLKFLKISNFR